MSWISDLSDFHHKYGIEYDGKPRSLPREIQEFRTKFLREEVNEHETSCIDLEYSLQREGSRVIALGLENCLDAIIDLIYVAIGTAHFHGFNEEILNEAWRRVHEANMKKVRVEKASDSKRGSTYDVVKPPGWQAPVLLDLVEDNAHSEAYHE